ncbi:hypothetical protein MtrunA17_Chr2g0326181 [Medicago truncatula]|uniref:Transmembrane protein n=1 Tax=Medicago truncatula TaxID=3880 RepID=Q2HSU6_MEDTR|nr:hypothetical protein MtrDRAFT_AC150891g30v2 [Medicago truncatula]RHN75898.1 hypothetical protein MtrunA17_Chr2g0326181 [Medicago truncatula]
MFSRGNLWYYHFVPSVALGHVSSSSLAIKITSVSKTSRPTVVTSASSRYLGVLHFSVAIAFTAYFLFCGVVFGNKILAAEIA